MLRTVGLLVGLFLLAGFSWAQSPNATVTGRVLDTSKLVIVGARVVVINVNTNASNINDTNSEGIYVVGDLPPGSYRIEVSKSGFKTIFKPDIVLHVQDVIAINFILPVGSASESITVRGGAPLVQTESAAVSTVVDRQFVENLPLNGRSFQALIELTPGVVLTPSTNFALGQFSVDGQRPSSNYYMVDGVAANIGIISGSPGQSAGGTAPGLSVQGGTNSLVSVDAMQEFRIQTSTYAPEFGRAPGAQISIATRSGTNAYHGALFEYFRNDVLDANDWFNDQSGAPKSAERQNDFGGVLGGPIVKDRTFFFVSYEGLRLRQPQFVKTCVPSAYARAQASPQVLPFLNAYPIANNDPGSCPANPPPFPPSPSFLAELDAGYSDPSTLNAGSVRMDQIVNSKLTIFGRYDYAPSSTYQRGGDGVATLSSVGFTQLRTQTLTLGTTWAIGPNLANDLRFNFSNNGLNNRFNLDKFHG
ncbi:MAG: carboxypeptidase regulatory-like domain-containing protein, partial [Blastocatellia bacterium]